MTIVEFSIGFADRFQFVSLTLIYSTMDFYFCWVLISYSKSKKEEEEIPHQQLAEFEPKERKAAYMEEMDMGPRGNTYHQVNKSSVSAMGQQGIFPTEEIKDATRVDFETDGYGRVN